MSPNPPPVTKKGEVWSGPKRAMVLQRAQEAIMSTPFVQPNQEALFRLETDASGYATGAVLSQLSDDGKWHPVGFTSKGLDLPRGIMQS